MRLPRLGVQLQSSFASRRAFNQAWILEPLGYRASSYRRRHPIDFSTRNAPSIPLSRDRVKRASTIPPSFLVQEKYLQGVVFYAEGQYVAAHGSEILYSRTYHLEAYVGV